MLKREKFILRDLGGIPLGATPLDPLIITSIDLGQPIHFRECFGSVPFWTSHDGKV